MDKVYITNDEIKVDQTGKYRITVENPNTHELEERIVTIKKETKEMNDLTFAIIFIIMVTLGPILVIEGIEFIKLFLNAFN